MNNDDTVGRRLRLLQDTQEGKEFLEAMEDRAIYSVCGHFWPTEKKKAMIDRIAAAEAAFEAVVNG